MSFGQVSFLFRETHENATRTRVSVRRQTSLKVIQRTLNLRGFIRAACSA